jgi:MFS family permease
VCLLAVVSLGNQLGWGSPLVIGLLAGAAVLLSGFVVRERETSDPLLDPSLFRRVPFTAGISSGLLSYLAMFGVLFVVPQLLEGGLRISSARTGLELTVMPVAFGLVAPFAGRMADRLGARSLTVTGMLMAAGGLVLLALAHESLFVLLAGLVVFGVGLGLFTPPNNAAIMGSAPREQSGVASGVLNMTRGMGTAMGLAFTTLVFELATGAARSGPAVSTGFRTSALFLAAACLVAAFLAGLRGRTELELGAATRSLVEG